jgi:hypothetical protein
MSSATSQPASPLARTRGVALLALPAFVVYTIPPIGFLASMLLPLIASRVRSLLWPRISPSASRVWSGLAVTGLWLPSLGVPAVVRAGGVGATIWLIIPLCTPSASAGWVTALLAISAYLAGLAVSAVDRHPWPWVLGAWLAPLAYEAASLWLVDSQFVC